MKEIAVESVLLVEGVWFVVKRHLSEVVRDYLVLSGVLFNLCLAILVMAYLMEGS